MKKILLLVALVVAMVSCTTEEYYTTSTDIFEKTYEVPASAWIPYDGEDGVYYYCEFRENVLTNDMYSNGLFKGYIVKYLKEVESLTGLPYTIANMNGTYRWTEKYDVEFSPGYVTFILTYDDFNMQRERYDVTFAVKYVIN